MPSPSQNAAESAAARTLKKRKTTDNLRGGKETASQAELRRNEAAHHAQDALDRARRNPSIGNLIAAFQQQEAATRTKPPKLNSDGSAAEGLDNTIQLFLMSCEDMATGPEADSARMRGDRWIDYIGVARLVQAIDGFLNDFQGKRIRYSPM